MRKIASVLCLLLLSGCAGLDVTWQFQATYMSEEYITKQQEKKRAEDIRRSELP